jgi:hypothetical protein
MEGHVVNECPRLRGKGPSGTQTFPPPVGLVEGVVQVVVTMPFHGPIQYHAFLNTQRGKRNEYCDIFRSHGHSPRHCPIFHKYTPMPKTIYCEFFGSPSHNKN